MASTHIEIPSPPISPVERRMVGKVYIDPSFKPKMKDKNIQSFLSTLATTNTPRSGRSSHAATVEIDGELFTLRITPYKTYAERMRSEREIAVYEQIKKNPEYINYISNLLYADAHLAAVKKESIFLFAFEPGQVLSDYIEEHKQSMTNEEIMKIYDYLLNSVEFLEKCGVVHRDIKPENIYFSFVRGIPLLFDFDASCRIGVDCVSYEFTGSPQYATPNSKMLRQQEGFSATTKVYDYTPIYDRYSIAVMLEKDLSKLAKTVADKEEIEAYAKQIQTMLLAQNKNKQKAGSRVGVLFPRFGGARNKTRKRGGAGSACGCTKQPMMPLPPGISLGSLTAGLKGGACPCQAVPKIPIPLEQVSGYKALSGGYRATKRNLKYLKLWKQGKPIGFTMRSSLKAKGLIPRANGTKRVSNKYKTF